MPFGFDDYFVQEEFIYPEDGGVTGTVQVACPYCSSRWEIEPDPGNSQDCRQCGECQQVFVIDWPKREVSKGASLSEIWLQTEIEKYLTFNCPKCSTRCSKSSIGAHRGVARCSRCGFSYEVIANAERFEPGGNVALSIRPTIDSEEDLDASFSLLLQFFRKLGTSRRDQIQTLSAMTHEVEAKGGAEMRAQWLQLIQSEFAS